MGETSKNLFWPQKVAKSFLGRQLYVPDWKKFEESREDSIPRQLKNEATPSRYTHPNNICFTCLSGSNVASRPINSMGKTKKNLFWPGLGADSRRSGWEEIDPNSLKNGVTASHLGKSFSNSVGGTSKNLFLPEKVAKSFLGQQLFDWKKWEERKEESKPGHLKNEATGEFRDQGDNVKKEY
jgi:hypothetical protein